MNLYYFINNSIIINKLNILIINLKLIFVIIYIINKLKENKQNFFSNFTLNYLHNSLFIYF